jgi:arsenite methyltransferase
VTAHAVSRPGAIARFRSRQSGHPSGVVGRIFGRAMVKDTADANDRTLALLHLTEPCTVLEVGFGQGRTVEVLLDAGHHVLGADPSPTMVRQANSRNRVARRNGRATLRQSDGIAIPFADRTADVAFSVHTVYFMPDPVGTFTDIARVLRPGGTLVVGCRTADTQPPAWMDPDVYRLPTAAHLTAMLTTAGFSRVDHHLADTAGYTLHLFAAHLANAMDVA